MNQRTKICRQGKMKIRRLKKMTRIETLLKKIFRDFQLQTIISTPIIKIKNWRITKKIKLKIVTIIQSIIEARYG